MAQAVEHLLYKHEALTSNLSSIKKERDRSEQSPFIPTTFYVPTSAEQILTSNKQTKTVLDN
jgi:hypothetical protein